MNDDDLTVLTEADVATVVDEAIAVVAGEILAVESPAEASSDYGNSPQSPCYDWSGF